MLVDNNGDEIGASRSLDDIAVATDSMEDDEPSSASGPLDDLMNNKALFAAVSVACLTAAVAAGSYAIWLGRRNAAQKALTSVHDLLKTCERRMTQMDKELKRLPRVQSGS
jgi:hypothetical protein